MKLAALILLLLVPLQALAAVSPPAQGEFATARLYTVEDGVAPGSARLSGAFEVMLDEGWKTYWRSPGEVGLPPELDWSGSTNVAGVEMLYPAPHRFEAFEIQNFGYSGSVAYPVEIALEDPGRPAALRAEATILVCSDFACVPETFALALDLPAGGGIDPFAAEIVAEAAARVPAETGARLEAAHLDAEALTVALTSETPFAAPDIFPEHGGTGFGAPEIRLAEDGTRLWARLPVTSTPEEADLALTLTDGARAVTLAAPLAEAPPAPPAEAQTLWRVALLALLGGLILNVMPCVLPVLAIKLTSAISAGGHAPARVRAEFLAAAAGILAFMAALGAATSAARAAGLSVGWGVQFQSPVFLAFIVAVLILFAANLAGLFEIVLPSRLATAMGQEREGLGGAFGTGAFAALLATPCSAPFLGTAVAFALSGGAGDIAAVFLALGIGLALPYLAVAAYPRAVRLLPRPGAWMVTVRYVLAGVLGLTALWFLTLLSGAAGLPAAGITAALAGLAVLILASGRLPAAALLLALAAVLAPLAAPRPTVATLVASAGWLPFDMSEIDARVGEGETVLVDVTADWCLTCKANKALVLTRGEVAEALAGDVTAMQADWTRPDPAIRAYIGSHGRAGIPLNVVYGPGAPGGIALPEVLTQGIVLRALDEAS